MDCVFCQIVTKEIPAFVIYEDEIVMAFLDKYPQSRGHLQLIPKKHFRWIYELPSVCDFFTTAQKITRGIIPILHADHVTWGTFGHEISHAHLWIVPRYKENKTVIEGGGRNSNTGDQKSLAEKLNKHFREEVSF